MKKLGIVLLILVLIAVPLVGTYNGLIKSKQAVDAQWANVESKLQRRFDLIPNLVESVKGAMAQEQAVFGQIANARAKLSGARTTDDRAAASSELEGAISRLLVVMENYPVLKSNEQVSALMTELAGTENRISVERDRYNEAVLSYNTKLVAFPTVIFAKMLGFKEANYFKATAGAENAPQVKF